MPDSILIRPERPDQPEVQPLLSALDGYLASLYPPEANHILDTPALLAPDVCFFVARAAGAAVGTAAYRRMAGERSTQGRPYGEVKRMYVAPGQRGRRIGARLLAALEEGMRAEGCALSLLETGAEQVEAVRLYRAAGYRERGAFAGYPDNGLSVFMAKTL